MVPLDFYSNNKLSEGFAQKYEDSVNIMIIHSLPKNFYSFFKTMSCLFKCYHVFYNLNFYNNCNFYSELHTEDEEIEAPEQWNNTFKITQVVAGRSKIRT